MSSNASFWVWMVDFFTPFMSSGYLNMFLLGALWVGPPPAIELSLYLFLYLHPYDPNKILPLYESATFRNLSRGMECHVPVLFHRHRLSLL